MLKTLDDIVSWIVTHTLHNNDLVATVILLSILGIIAYLIYLVKRSNKRNDVDLIHKLSDIKVSLNNIKQSLLTSVNNELQEISEIEKISNATLKLKFEVLEGRLNNIDDKLKNIENSVAGWKEFKGFMNGIQKKRFPEL